jgi:transposase
MEPTAHHQGQSTGSTGQLYVALELSAKEWRLACSISQAARPVQRVIRAGDEVEWARALAGVRARFGLSADVAICSCYEAGRDAFWVHRWLTQRGVHNVVVDAASIEVTRQARRAKTDRLDAGQLLRQLIRWASGERGVWRTVRVPSEAMEDARHVGRTLSMMKTERTRYLNRLSQLLATQHVSIAVDAEFVPHLGTAQTAVGTPLGPGLQTRLRVCYELLQAVERAIAQLETLQHEALRAAQTAAATQVRRFTALKGIGERFAWVLATEVCAREDLRNRRQVGALTGLVPVPYASGAMQRDQGISGAGLQAVRELAVEMAWVWVQWQPESALTQWYQRRFANGGRRARRVGIVAVARKLVIALWRYARDGNVPTGAVYKVGHAPPPTGAPV